jgi:hypothetical protein
MSRFGPKLGAQAALESEDELPLELVDESLDELELVDELDESELPDLLPPDPLEPLEL